tara:strand:+ start:322 stop:1620 length:1299 start_codon:yes stop_codon:yes gene_type:complete
MNRRNFIEMLLSSTALSLTPYNVFPKPYTGNINWAGISFLIATGDGNSNIESQMPILKAASEIQSENGIATFFNDVLTKSLEKKPKIIEFLNLKGQAKKARLALTFGFSAEFDFGRFEDLEENGYNYLMRFFGHCILYNPLNRIVVSSVPVRAIIGNLIKKDEADKNPNMKIQLMKRAFYNATKPETTILHQFRIMLSKLSLANEWRGAVPRVTLVKMLDKKNILFNKEFALKKEQFVEFVGQATTAAYVYKFNKPITPYSQSQATGDATLRVFDHQSRLYKKIDLKFPDPEIEIKITHKGWQFKEKLLQDPNLQVDLYVGIKIEMIDKFTGVNYTQHFLGHKRYIQIKDKGMRSDASEVCQMTEGLLERAFFSIIDEEYRKKMIKGDLVPYGNKSGGSARFKLNVNKKDPEYITKLNEQSKAIQESISSLK